MKPNIFTYSPQQLPFIMSGKWYMLVWLIARVVLAVLFIGRVRRGEPSVTALSIAGALLFVSGFAMRRWSMRVMGERFRGFEVRREALGLESGGPYAIVRHPSYLGLALKDIGLPLLLNLPWGLLLSSVLI